MGVVIPSFESRTLKDLACATVASEQPLTVKKLYNKLRRNYGVTATYQAVHKAVASLVMQGVLVKKHRVYSVNPHWVANLSRFVQDLQKSTARHSGIIDSKEEGQVQTLTFASMERALEFKKQLQKEFFERRPMQPMVYAGEDSHVISPLIYSERSLTLLNLISAAKATCYLVVRGDTPIDRWCADYYRNGGVLVRTGVKCAEHCDLLVLADRIVQIYIPVDIKEELDRIYQGAKRLSDVKIPELYNKVFKKKARVTVAITQNPALAEHVRQRIAGYFSR
ncbi:hypothetical protein HY642_02370 [Candidatus Woesearchaeota archaeon]|nr:hypothetical protein [Candidatus Woesearchaeota archaeon]